MDDNKIVELYWERREEAIKETALKYGRLCTHIAKNILLSCEDSEECVNDTYFAVWNAIPNERPNRFSAFISRITRNLALKKYEYISAAKRNPIAITSLEELGDCVSGTESPESEIESRRIEITIENSFGGRVKKRELFLSGDIGILILLKTSVKTQVLHRVK